MAKKSLKERLQNKREELAKGGSGKGDILFLKEGTKRVRTLPVGEDEEFVVEVTHFYLGAEIKGVFSPATFGEPCAIMEAYEELKNSKDPNDKELAKKFVPKKKYLMPVLVYKDTKGKEPDEYPIKLVQLTGGLYQDIIDLYLDEDDWGDMTDAKEGYDLKLTRSGSGVTDTEYSVIACKPTKLPRRFSKETYDIEEMVKAAIPRYEETEDIISKFLKIDDDEDEEPKKKKKKSSSRKKKRKSDI